MGGEGTIRGFGQSVVVTNPDGVSTARPVQQQRQDSDAFVSQDTPLMRQRAVATSPERVLAGGGPVVSGAPVGPHERVVPSQGFTSWASFIAHHYEGRTPTPELIDLVARANGLDPTAALPPQVRLPNVSAIFEHLHPGLRMDMRWLVGAHFVVTAPGQTWGDFAREVLGPGASEAQIAVAAEVLARHNEALAPPVVVALPNRNDLLKQMEARAEQLRRQAWLEKARQSLGPNASRAQVWQEAQRLAQAQGETLDPPWRHRGAGQGPWRPGVFAAQDNGDIAKLGGDLRDRASVPTPGRAYTVKAGDTLHSIVLKAYGAELLAYAETLRVQLAANGWAAEKIEAHIKEQLARKVEDYELVLMAVHRLGMGGNPLDPVPEDVVFLPLSLRLDMIVAGAEQAGELAKQRVPGNRSFAHVQATSQSVLSDVKALAMAPAPAMSTDERIEALEGASSALRAQGAQDAFAENPFILPWVCSPSSFLAYLTELYGDSATGRYPSESFLEYVERKNPDMTPSQFAAEAQRADQVAGLLEPVLASWNVARGGDENGFVTLDVQAGESAGQAFLRMLREQGIVVQPELGKLIEEALTQAYGWPSAGEQRLDVLGAVYMVWQDASESGQPWIGPILKKYEMEDEIEPTDISRRPALYKKRSEQILDVVLIEHGIPNANAVAENLRAELLNELRRRVETDVKTKKDLKAFEARIRDLARDLVREELTGRRAAFPRPTATV
ncbi:MAG: hypothetical protein HYZ27_12185 [Deltaproteobacteria bacterium]|nr:hypothetical protein [Deltaproteobacteria bacterium]